MRQQWSVRPPRVISELLTDPHTPLHSPLLSPSNALPRYTLRLFIIIPSSIHFMFCLFFLFLFFFFSLIHLSNCFHKFSGSDANPYPYQQYLSCLPTRLPSVFPSLDSIPIARFHVSSLSPLKSLPTKFTILSSILLLLAGDIEINPGPCPSASVVKW